MSPAEIANDKSLHLNDPSAASIQRAATQCERRRSSPDAARLDAFKHLILGQAGFLRTVCLIPCPTPFDIRRPDPSDTSRRRRHQQKTERNRKVRRRLLQVRKRATGSVLSGGRVPPKPTLAQKRGAELSAFLAAELNGRRGGLRDRVVVFPERFSFIEDSESTVEALASLASVCGRSAGRTVHIDQSPCILLDYGAETVAGVIARAARDGQDVRFTGTYPIGSEAREIAAATGLPSLLGIPAPWHPSFHSFPLRQGHQGKETAHKSSERERVADEFACYLDECLSPYGIRLSYTGIGRMCSLLGEVIGNAEDHCGRDEWWIGGYLRQTDDDFGDCHVVLFNMGRTIYQSMQGLPAKSLLRTQIEALAARHSQRRLFRPTFSEEELWTLYALQAGASRYQTSPVELDSTRGQGLADMVTWFQELGGTSKEGAEPRMCLVSGRTYIRFNPSRYPMREQETQSGDRRRIIAFNDTNDLELPPDNRSVRRLSTFFPGTVISLRLYLDGHHLRTLPLPEDSHE